jgi:hypothetical protein
MKLGTSACVAFIMMFSAIAIKADVIRLHDGRIYLGKVSNADASGITVDSFGTPVKLSPSDILLNEKDLASLKGQFVEVRLKDGSVLRGKIQNYDDEIGALLNIDFGTITLPPKSIERIVDPVQLKKFAGYPFLLGVTGGYYIPVGKTADNFKNSWRGDLFAEFATGLMDNLYAGIDAGYISTSYKNNSKLSYVIYPIYPYLVLRYHGFRNSSAFLSRFTPFVSVGAGVAYVDLTDKRPEAFKKNQSELDPLLSGYVGIDMNIISSVSIRIKAGGEWIHQKNDPFTTAAFSAGITYGL